MNPISYGWRNLWRNTRRTVITLAAVALSAAILVIMYALMDGMAFHMRNNAINLTVGEVQAHAPGYLKDRSLYKVVEDPDKILAAAQAAGVGAVARAYGYGLVAADSKSAGAVFWGVDPVKEYAAFSLPHYIAQGSYLGPEPKSKVVLGAKLARSLNAKLGDELVVVVQAADGSMGNELFHVTGIFKIAGDQVDRAAVMMHAADFQRLFVSGGRVHEVALNSRDGMDLDKLAGLAQEAAPQNQVRTWQELLPMVSDMLKMSDASGVITSLLFGLAAALGVMNTMLMATYERMREFGIIKALGASGWRILRDVSLEAMVLAVVGTAFGVVLGVAGSWYLQEVGLDLGQMASEFTIGGLAFATVWKAVLTPHAVITPVLVMWAVCLVAAVYPASLAARLDPVKVIHHT
jgi:ABC-type lipoprotein release transport system permease subunit